MSDCKEKMFVFTLLSDSNFLQDPNKKRKKEK